MLRFKRKKDARRKTADLCADLSPEELKRTARKRILYVAVVGLFLVLADLFSSFGVHQVHVVSENGQLYLLRPAAEEDAGHISLRARVGSGDDAFEETFEISLQPQRNGDEEKQPAGGPVKKVSAQDLFRSELKALVSQMNDDLSAVRVRLPLRLSGGERVTWKRCHQTHTALLLLLTLGLALLIFRSRLTPLRKLQNARQRSVLRHLPTFINQLSLLLNAGLILNRAFEKTVEQSLGDPSLENDYFHRNMRQICLSVRNTNSPMHRELQRFAAESGVSELIRISNIIADNVSKGAALNEKLEQEAEALWASRKAGSEERGRLAETKMTLPLAIFLCVLIIITVAPALLQLQP